MLTNEDIQKLVEVFATKDDIVSKKEFELFLEDFNELRTSIDKYAQKADAYFQEMVMLTHKVDRHEKWLQQLAQKLDIKLEY